MALKDIFGKLILYLDNSYQLFYHGVIKKSIQRYKKSTVFMRKCIKNGGKVTYFSLRMDTLQLYNHKTATRLFAVSLSKS